MPFGIGWGVAKVQILKNSETGPISWNILNILIKSKKISNDQELIQSDPTSCPQNQKGNN